MKNKTKVVLILMLNFVVLTVGISTAYYNTKSFGFDENTRLITADDEKIVFMDFEIKYNSIKYLFDEMERVASNKPYAVFI